MPNIFKTNNDFSKHIFEKTQRCFEIGFFQLIAGRYEYRPTILTTNQPFSKWPDVFGDAVIANAIIDRLVHHCDIVKITGHSYRIKGRNIFDESDD